MADKKEKKGKVEVNVDPEAEKTEVTIEGDPEDENRTEEESAAAEAEAEEEAAASDAEETASEETKKTGGFRKKEKKDKRDEQIAELNDRLMRQMAEFDNYRKRTEKEKASMYEVGAKEVIEKLLPIVDNFERGLADADGSDPFADGILKIYKQLTTALEEMGVTPIESVGCEFDPNMHNAVMHVDDENEGTNVIVEEFQKGYKYKDNIIRYSMVKVAN